MTLIILIGILLLLWMANYVFGKLFPPHLRRGGYFIFWMVVGAAIAVLLFKVLKTLFVIAIPIVVILGFLVVTRKK
ncbi:MAG: hypothetical protein EOO50_14145 [Flavobacterium sp.]|uniref:hypothetical protein n=1 Tax=Flavobacterium sp. TaxID=239 RepID=UPI001217F07A|nr:hypothetical protein [Flavobacterium sp.]RZJ65317.1 MAG: hypothetical protein EOO50_14145 [Flavobacterium sp.]